MKIFATLILTFCASFAYAHSTHMDDDVMPTEKRRRKTKKLP